jgi:DNA-binding transcriptional LysR family regulator
MDVRDLTVFLAVAEELHFGRAAERLYTAQPPVSRTIRRLEDELGSALFQRDTRNVELTNAGRALIDPAREILENIRLAVLLVRSADRGESGLVRMAYAGASTQVMVGRLAREARAKLPGIVLELMSQNFAEPAMSRVMRGEVDIALGRWDFLPAGVSSRLLAIESLVLAVPSDHPLASRTRTRIIDFRDEPFIALTPHPGSVLGDRFRRLCHTAGFEPNVVQVVPDTWTAISIVGAGVGVAVTVSTAARNITDPSVSFIEIIDPVRPVELRIAWLEKRENPAVHAIIELSTTAIPTPVDID